MLEPNRIQMDPQTIQKLGNGTYYYDIKEISVEVLDLDNTIKEKTYYSFIQVLLNGQPNYKDCVKAIVRRFLTVFDLINSYNSYSENLTSEVINEYKEYLNILKQIKAKVKEDFAKL